MLEREVKDEQLQAQAKNSLYFEAKFSLLGILKRGNIKY